ncbi:MAG TPA: magnesium chelatase [Lachnospiraceae bacterium]|nr:magnesium chelatase [Lachnospiraceae bacterium]
MNPKELYLKVLDNVRKVMIGKDETFSLIFAAILSGGHVLLEDNPGTGKTTLAKCIAKSIDGEMKRVQFTPDLMPQDITGINVYSRKDEEFHLIKGPVFTNILLADEINRATPRTQSSLLEAMEERSCTIDRETLVLPEPFLVIATENPIETTGTYPLPEAQLDRFLIRLSMDKLEKDEETAVLERFRTGSPYEELSPVCSCDDIISAALEVRNTFVHKCIEEYIVDIAAATRNSSKLLVGVSPRASLSLMRVSQAFAAISGRGYVIPDDVRFLAPFVFGHRIVTVSGIQNTAECSGIIKDIVKGIAVPTENWTE